MAHDYASILAREGEGALLLAVVKQHPLYVLHYGKQLAADHPQETFEIFAQHIMAEAEQATDRRKYKGVCRIIKALAEAGGKECAINLIEQVQVMYHRRPALLEELFDTRRKLSLVGDTEERL